MNPFILSIVQGMYPLIWGAAQWIDKTLDLVSPTFEKVMVSGDTDFSLTDNFDRWDERCTFLFGMNSRKNLVKIACDLAEPDWQLLEKKPIKINSQERKKPENVKDKVVKARNFIKIQTELELFTEFEYKPGKCRKSYRMIVIR